MKIMPFVYRALFRRLVATPAGRAHVLSLMIRAEEGDEAGVFERLQQVTDEDELRKLIARHQADEHEHADLYRACLERNGLLPDAIPDELLIVRHLTLAVAGPSVAGAQTLRADALSHRQDVMETYALLLAIEERGVQQFPIIGQEFRRIGDVQTADTFDRVTRDEVRHTRYCRAIGRRYAPDAQTWEHAVARFRVIENRAFKQVGLAIFGHAIKNGLIHIWS